jgi:hypothetical protein
LIEARGLGAFDVYSIICLLTSEQTRHISFTSFAIAEYPFIFILAELEPLLVIATCRERNSLVNQPPNHMGFLILSLSSPVRGTVREYPPRKFKYTTTGLYHQSNVFADQEEGRNDPA